VHLPRPEGADEAFPLQGLLLRIHGVGDVDRDDEGEVHLGLGGGGERRDKERRCRYNEQGPTRASQHPDSPSEHRQCGSFSVRCKADVARRYAAPIIAPADAASLRAGM
jgi:hypothetical protein